MSLLATIPSPNQGVWHLGFFPVRAYALCILLGIVVAVWLGDRRYTERGGDPGVVLDIAAWAVPFGIVGGRLYHVVTSWQGYFGPNGDPVRALYVWEGGLGIWGAVALGALGAWIAARRRGVLLPPLADALAPGIVIAQGIGRWGNYFNNELYGGPTTLPWGLKVHEWDQAAGRAVTNADGQPLWLPGAYHPTFLYESLWDIGVGLLLILLDRRYRIGHGRVFALYGALYTAGRLWIEALRIDPANTILGLRLNIWTSVLVGVAALIAFGVSLARHPGRETVLVRGAAPDATEHADATGETDDASGDEHGDEATDETGDAPGDEPGDDATGETDDGVGDDPRVTGEDAGTAPQDQDAGDDERAGGDDAASTPASRTS